MIRSILKNRASFLAISLRTGFYLSFFCLFTFFLPPDNICLAQNIEDSEDKNWGRGPIELRDIFPLNIGRLNYKPSSTEVQNKANISFHFANTENTNASRYIIDAETRELSLNLKRLISDDLEFSFSLPLYWQGSGVFDSFIFDWHKFWGLPQGPRASTGNSEYNVSGLSSRNFDIEQTEVKFGDTILGLKKLISTGSDALPAVSASVEARLPTGSNAFSPGSIDLTLDLLLSKKYNDLVLYSGIYYSYFHNQFFNDIRYKQDRYGGFMTFEYLYSERLSLLFTLLASSNLTSDIELFPNHQVYADFGFKYGLNQNLELELNLRENPTPSKGSSDVSSSFGLSYRY